ncbi:YbaK/EbsC family protein [Bradyrhizobium sp. LHD-71]|uniref:prolyl-tRNA synthetase associated domain-containing protein n=1 Tax=Bradyrhizobium sp. LHD-71 TaxID=3072141 RepID=UPI00280E51DC|nr:YbaK/EbsC family protein [Bradyrhizobium sp. LHD-71]MDQ8732857.1 YbaK/EbsC family protein [Bradyrhizobium sp. LHD-71]
MPKPIPQCKPICNATICTRPPFECKFRLPGPEMTLSPASYWYLSDNISRSMLASPQDLLAFLDRLGIRHQTASHAPLFTVADSQSLRGQIAGGHTKNLFLKDKPGSLFLIVADEEARIDLKSIHRRIDARRLSFGSAALLMQHLGVQPGSVTPFAAINDPSGAVSVVLDQTLMAHQVLNFHPLTNTMTTSIAAQDLLKFLRATGHEPRVLSLSEAAEATAQLH